MQHNFISIDGNIGIGKTTLVKKLAQHLNAHTFFEEFNDNPWLPLFYKNPHNNALALELSLLTDRFRQLTHIQKQDASQPFVSDYSLDKCLLFAKINLSPQDYVRYEELYKQVSANLSSPSLVIVLHTPLHNLLQNIKQRNRSYEQQISPHYIEQLNEAYHLFYHAEKPYHILNIHTNELTEEAYEHIFKKINSLLSHGNPQKINTLSI